MDHPEQHADLTEVVAYADDYLRVREVADEPNALNGLQVENQGRIGRIVAAVDASLVTIEGVADRATPEAPPLLLVHHGLFWDGNQPVIGRRYWRLRALLRSNVALYSAHIPLDLHPEVGNNVQLAERLGLRVEGWFGNYRGQTIGVWGRVPEAIADRESLKAALDRVLQTGPAPTVLIPGGPQRCERIGIVTGAAGSMIAAARAAGLDTFITGEGAHHTYFDAMEGGINVLYAGHYATETLGVQALAAHLARRFGLPWEFHDHPTGL